MALRSEKLEQLTAYIDGELSGAERLEVEKLLGSDAEARRLVEELRQASRLVSTLPRAKAPADLSASVLAKLERDALLGELEARQPKRPRSLGWVRMVGVAAGTALILTAGWLMRGQTRPMPGKSVPIAMAEKRDSERPRTGARDAGADRRLARGGVESSDKTKVGGGTADRSARRDKDGETERVAMGRPRVPADTGSETVRAPGPASMAPSAQPLEKESASVVAEETLLAAKAAVSPAREGGLSAQSRPGGTAVLAENSALSRGEMGMQYNAISRPEPGSFSNHLEVMADAGTRDRLVKQVEHFMLSNRIPDLRLVKEPAPIQDEQPFYYVEAAGRRTGGAAPADRDSSDGSVEIVLNAPAPQVERLLESMQDVVEKDRANVGWMANAINISGADSATQVMQQLSSNRVNEPGGHVAAAAPPAAKPVAERAQWLAKGDESKEESGEAKVAVQSGPRAQGAARPRSGVAEEKRAEKIVYGGAAERAAKTGDFITVAISFRVQKSSMQQTTSANSVEPAAAIPTSAPAQSQSTMPGGGR